MLEQIDSPEVDKFDEAWPGNEAKVVLHVVVPISGGDAQVQGCHPHLLLHGLVDMKIIIALIRPRERIRLTIEAGEGNIRRAWSIVASTTVAKVMEAAVTSISAVAVSVTMIVSAIAVSIAMIVSVVAVSKVKTVAAAIEPHGAITGVMAQKEASAS